jgi:deazaflavin-dependent oxidoreductase (nitroreductase family)
MHIPRFMRRVNRVLTNPVLGMFAWVVPPLAVVHHFGRKSRRSYRTPVVAFRSAAGFVIPMTYGRDVDWALNIVRAHGCELERLGRRVTLRNPRIVNLETAEHRLPAALRPFFRAADFPGSSCSTRIRTRSWKDPTPELRALIAELAPRDVERDQSQRRDESSPSP